MNSFFNQIANSPGLIPLYLFCAFMLLLLGWEFLKLIVFIIQNSSWNKPKKESKKK
jgi:hypothetical protein